MEFEAHLERVVERCIQDFIFISWTAVRVAISDIVRHARIDRFLDRCARINGFLMPNVSNFYEQHSVRMYELEVGKS